MLTTDFSYVIQEAGTINPQNEIAPSLYTSWFQVQYFLGFAPTSCHLDCLLGDKRS